MLEEKFDYVIIINGLSTNFPDEKNELIELNWCTYDLKKKSVNSDICTFIKPSRLNEIPAEFLNKYHIDNTQLENAEELLVVLKKFNMFIFESFINNNFSFALLTKDDWLLGRNGQLIKEAQWKNIKLGYHFTKYINLIREFKCYYKVDKIGDSKTIDLQEILQFYSLKRQTEVERPTLQELNTMVRIVNRMVKEGYELNSSKLISGTESQEIITGKITQGQTSNVRNLDKQEELRDKTSSQHKIKEISDKHIERESISSNKITTHHKAHAHASTKLEYSYNKPEEFFIRLKNLPSYFTKKEILDILHMYNLLEDDIVISYDIFGNQTGDFILRLSNETCYKQILSLYNYRLICGKLIEIVPSNDSEYQSSLKSANFTEESNLKNLMNRKIFIKIKNLPYSAKEETIRQLLKTYSIAENGIKLFKNKKGNFLGETIVALNSEEEAARCLKEKNGEAFLNQVISIEYSNFEEFELYANTNGFYFTMKNISDYVNPEIVTKSIFISGLPLGISKNDILNHLQVFNLNESNLILDEKLFSNYGCLIVTLSCEEDATALKAYLNRITFRIKTREKKINADNVLLLVNKGNES
jgi:inhibitor of KinA sporulation pathway (predicted exonuclease)